MNQSPQDTSVILEQQPHVRGRSVGDDLVLYSPHTDEVTLLDQTGAMVWQLLEQPTTLNDLVEIVVESFAVERAVAAHDLRELTSVLLAAELVRSEAG